MIQEAYNYMRRDTFLAPDTFFTPDTFLASDSIVTFENREIEKLESEKQSISNLILKAMYETKKLPD